MWNTVRSVLFPEPRTIQTTITPQQASNYTLENLQRDADNSSRITKYTRQGNIINYTKATSHCAEHPYFCPVSSTEERYIVTIEPVNINRINDTSEDDDDNSSNQEDIESLYRNDQAEELYKQGTELWTGGNFSESISKFDQAYNKCDRNYENRKNFANCKTVAQIAAQGIDNLNQWRFQEAQKNFETAYKKFVNCENNIFDNIETKKELKLIKKELGLIIESKKSFLEGKFSEARAKYDSYIKAHQDLHIESWEKCKISDFYDTLEHLSNSKIWLLESLDLQWAKDALNQAEGIIRQDNIYDQQFHSKVLEYRQAIKLVSSAKNEVSKCNFKKAISKFKKAIGMLKDNEIPENENLVLKCQKNTELAQEALQDLLNGNFYKARDKNIKMDELSIDENSTFFNFKNAIEYLSNTKAGLLESLDLQWVEEELNKAEGIIRQDNNIYGQQLQDKVSEYRQALKLVISAKNEVSKCNFKKAISKFKKAIGMLKDNEIPENENLVLKCQKNTELAQEALQDLLNGNFYKARDKNIEMDKLLIDKNSTFCNFKNAIKEGATALDFLGRDDFNNAEKSINKAEKYINKLNHHKIKKCSVPLDQFKNTLKILEESTNLITQGKFDEAIDTLKSYKSDNDIHHVIQNKQACIRNLWGQKLISKSKSKSNINNSLKLISQYQAAKHQFKKAIRLTDDPDSKTLYKTNLNKVSKKLLEFDGKDVQEDQPSVKKSKNNIDDVQEGKLGKRTEFDGKDVQEDQPSVKKSKNNDDYNNAGETEIDEKRDNMDDEKNQDIQVSQPTVQDLWDNAWTAENDENDRSEEAANLFQQCQDRVQQELNLHDTESNKLMSDIVMLKIQGNHHFNQGQLLLIEGNTQDALNAYQNAYEAFRAAAAIADTDTITDTTRFIDCMDLANRYIEQCVTIEGNSAYLLGADTHTQYQH